MQKKINLVYLAGPIDCDEEQGRNPVRSQLASGLNMVGVNTYDPAQAFNWITGGTGGEKLILINDEALRQSDLMVICLRKPVFTVGTFRELEKAVKTYQIPVILYTYIEDIDQIIYLSDVYRVTDKIAEVITMVEAMNGK